MATLFVDLENGNDNYGGTSFAVLQQGTNGRITSTTFSSAGASFPNDGTLIGQYLSIFNGTSYLTYNITAWVSSTSLTIAQISGGDALANQAVDRQFYIGGRWKTLTTGASAARLQPGDTVRVMGSPAPTSLGINGTWTSQALQGAKTITTYSAANPTVITVTAHGYSTGDTVVITGVSTNTGVNGTWEITVTGTNTFTIPVSGGTGGGGGSVRLRNNTRVSLASALTANIASTGPGRAAWTAVAGGNVTTSLNTTAKEHYQSDSIAIAAGFTTGLVAYWPTGTLNLSGYQQVSFWILQTVGAIGAAGAIELRLCSDTAGVTAVNTISIPSLAVTSRFMPITVDLGTNLGSSIQSIALYRNTNNGAQTFLLSNIIACKASSAADSLTLTSLIGKNTTGETFWGIQSINGTRVMLDMDTNATPTSTTLRGYYGTSETVTTYKRETIKLGPAASVITALQTIQESGTDGTPITFSGGWDRTNMSTQNLETWIDGVNGQGYGITYGSLVSFIELNQFAAVRCYIGVIHSSNGTAVKAANFNLIAANNNGTGIQVAPAMTTGTISHCVANSSDGVSIGSNTPIKSFIGNYLLSNGGAGLSISGNGKIKALAKNNSTYGISVNRYATLSDCEVGFNGTTNVFVNFPLAFATNILNTDAQQPIMQNVDSWLASHNHDRTSGNHKIFQSGGLISAATDQRHTASGVSWKMQPTSTTRDSTWPLVFSLAKVACAANSLVTVKAWMRRDNAGLTMRLVCKGGQIAGVANDVSASVTTTNAWEEETITFTPTETGVVEITAEAWGGTIYSGWVDDMTISQA